MPRTSAYSDATSLQSKFATVPATQIPRSVFDRSHVHKTTFDAGYLIPILCDEVLPGDTLSCRTTAFIRMSTPIYPVLDNLFASFFFFSCPKRILWTNWVKMMGEQDDPGDSTDFYVPQFTSTTVTQRTLSDYIGIPPGVSLDFNSWWHRCYNRVWKEWFRDEDLQDSPTIDTGDGPDNMANYELLKRGKRHDYFTSCRPWAQKGTAVELPLGTTAPVISAGTGIPEFTISGTDAFFLQSQSSGADAVWDRARGAAASAEWDVTSLQADLTNATAATINAIREAFQAQRMLEKDARAGTRYQELLMSHFGVTNPDLRMQRPEYLGGGRVRISYNPVVNSAWVTNPVGQLAGYASQVADGIGFTKSFTEHCVILGLVCVHADLTYQQGLHRKFSRQDRYDYYWPSLAFLGEQEVLSKEIYVDGTANDDDVFGYQERWAEYRYEPSRTSAQMRSTDPTPLDPWHFALEFSSRPLLNDTFIQEDPPVDRTQYAPTEPNILADIFFNYKHVRPMPTRSVPGLIDHF